MHPAWPTPVITVIIPTFNRAGSISAAVESVLSQGVSAIEVVVVDDGSTDNTLSVLRDLSDQRVRVETTVHSGRCNARNLGVDSARAPWVTFLDSDDQAREGWLSGFVASLGSGAMLASCGAHFRYEDGSTKDVLPRSQGPAFGMVIAQFLAGTFAVQRALFQSVGGYLPDLDFGENTELGMRLGTEIAARGGRVAADDRALLEVRATHREYDATRLYESGVLTLGQAANLLTKDPALHASYLAITGVAASRLGRGRDARQLLRQAWVIQPTNFRHPLRVLRSWAPVSSWR